MLCTFFTANGKPSLHLHPKRERVQGMKEEEPAILVRRAKKRYGDGKYILDDLNMTVKKGTIYGLLGASGCGKTTLLSTITGRIKLQSGVVRVLGGGPGGAKTIGYMPQDIALVGEFSVKEAVQHFGWIFGMTTEQIDVRFEFLSKLLDLPPANKLVKNLSGGQKRRVSLAVVLVHDPQLLILDEPTVGLDPVLRQDIWDYLVKITQEQKTIIITTHYIEEAKQAHCIGLMRDGKILVEGKPQDLIDSYGCSTIENVFIQLSRKQTLGQLTYEVNNDASWVEKNQFEPIEKEKKTFLSKLKFTNTSHAKALLSKNFLKFRRHPGTLMFAFGFPFLEISLFFLAIGRFPDDVKIGIINEEMGNYTNCEEYKLYNPVGGFLQEDNETCLYHGLACRFIDNLGEKLKNKVYFQRKEEALEAVRRQEIHQFLHFPYNFSKAVTLVRNQYEISDEDLDTQHINIFRDIIDSTLSTVVQKELFETYKKYAEGLALDCHTNTHSEKLPIKFHDPVYGGGDLTYRDFMAPGMIVMVTAFLAMGISSMAIITERAEGVWDRTLVAGVSKAEILIFHTLTMCTLSLVQIIELFVLTFYVFKQDCKGDKLHAFLLVYLQSIAGACLGILISVVSRTVTEANCMALGAFYPFISLSGCIWPREGMPKLLKSVSFLIPTTLSVDSMNAIVHKGWGIGRKQVLTGFLSSIGFVITFTLLSVIILSREKK